MTNHVRGTKCNKSIEDTVDKVVNPEIEFYFGKNK